MSKKNDIVIIGGGVVGASVAYHLSERGVRDVVILEREDVQGLGSTGKATGGVRAQFETDINVKMSMYSIDFFKNWSFDCGYDPKGYLFFTTKDETLELLRENVRKQNALGVADVELIDVDSIKKMVPGMNCDDIVGASFRQSDGFIDPVAVMDGFTQAAADRGVRMSFGVTVTSINQVGRKIRSVSTNKGEIECSTVVLCAGAWAKSIGATAGVDLPVEPLRRQIVWGRTKDDLPTNLPMVIDLDCGFHFRPGREFGKGVASRPDSKDIVFAFPDTAEMPSFNFDFDESFISKVRDKAKHRAQFLFETEIVREKCRAGLYENTPDHHAILGGCEIEGLYFANGFSGHGVMHSPATGRALAEIILDGEASFLDVSSLRLDRFANGKMFRESAYI